MHASGMGPPVLAPLLASLVAEDALPELLLLVASLLLTASLLDPDPSASGPSLAGASSPAHP